jgi:DNA-binding MarR family transcriptional regulator
MGILHITQSYGIVKDFTGWDNLRMGVTEDVFERLRRIAFEGEHVERMAALNAQMKLSPGVIKMLVRLYKEDGISMGDVARSIGVDPSYITALVDDLDQRGLARREPAPYDRRVKIIVLTDEGRKLGQEIDAVLSVPPQAFKKLSQAELRQLRDLLDKVLAPTPDVEDLAATKVTAGSPS